MRAYIASASAFVLLAIALGRIVERALRQTAHDYAARQI